MKFLLPTVGLVSAAALFAFSTFHESAIAVEKPRYTETFEQLDLFATVLARVNADYVVETDNTELIDDAINGMLQALDPHSSYINPDAFDDMQISTKGEYGGLGMEVTSEEGVVKVVSPIDDTPAKRAGIESGDYLTAIDGESILGLSLNEAVDRMRGKPGEAITVTIVREDEEPREITMVREIIKRQVVKAEVKDGMGYLRISQFNERTEETLLEGIEKLKKELGRNLPGVVVDLRGNPGGLLDQSVKVSSVFLDGGEVVSTRGRSPDDNDTLFAKNGEKLKGVPIIVLIDRASASASEIVAGAIQDRGRGLVVGMTSFGKGSVQSVIPLGPGGKDGALRLTTARYYTPAGRSIQGTGIDPDIYISYGPDNGKGVDGFRESSLPNSIQNEKEELEDFDEAHADVKIEYPPEGFEIDDDFQLKRAIEILKSGQYKTLLAQAKP